MRKMVMKTVYYSLRETVPAIPVVDPIKWVGRERFHALMRAQAGCCYLCCRMFGADLIPTVDHVVPRSRGGPNAGNVLLACSPCNQQKADRMPTKEEAAILLAINLHISEKRRGSIITPDPRKVVEERIRVADPLKPRRLALIERMRSL